jgi:quercetin dioxygenase-like cupin family protein
MSTQPVAAPPAEVPIHVPAGSGEQVWWIEGTLTVKLAAEQTRGQIGMWEFAARRGAASPLHVHGREDEYFVLTEGEASFFIGEQRIDAGPGDVVFLPRKIPHAYLVTSETARMMVMVTPGGQEAFFIDVGVPVAAGEPAVAPAREAMAAGIVRHGGRVMGPPPTLD